LRVNHYRLRSFEELLSKKIQSIGYMAGDYRETDFEDLDNESSSVKDLGLIEFLKYLDIITNKVTIELYLK